MANSFNFQTTSDTSDHEGCRFRQSFCLQRCLQVQHYVQLCLMLVVYADAKSTQLALTQVAHLCLQQPYSEKQPREHGDIQAPEG